MTAAVAIFAKAPVPGQVKTRLTPPLTPAEAAQVARVCLEETMRRFVPAVRAQFSLHWDGPADSSLLDRATGLGLEVFPQSEGDLGARLRAAFRLLRLRGASKTLAIGSDSPTLDPSWIAAAIDALDETDLVLGPAEDGGYYLIGEREETVGIFEGIPWSTTEVARVTLERAKALGLSVHRLPRGYDVDDAESLRRALRESAPESRLTALASDPRFAPGWRPHGARSDRAPDTASTPGPRRSDGPGSP